ncbi:efflux RND transporter periplasmic adaptor subunit [Chloroflexota bacterium]
MRRWRTITVLLLCLVLASATACNPFGGEKEVNEELVEVVRGDLSVTVSGSGTIEVSNETKLTFGIGGRIDKIYVEEGDKVSEGDVLAKLETDTLELAMNQAKVAYAQAEVAVTEAEVAVIQYGAAVTEAEVNLKNAEINLEQTTKTSTFTDIRIAQAAMDSAERDLDDALIILSKYDEGTLGYGGYQKIVVQVQARYQTAKDRYDAMLLGFGTKEVLAKKQQVDAAEQTLEVARQSLELAKLSPELARQLLELAQQSLEQAQKQLDKAAITAPFDSVVASVAVDKKDTVSTATTIVHLIDPSSMELEVQVDEIDVTEVKPGQRAIIEVDALPATLLEGKVSSISLLPKEEAGVIVYDVTVDFDVAEGIGLRAGMSATADIITAERNNVLLVPDRAIKQDSQGNPVVEVVVNEQIEERVVVTGISDGFETEISDGLEEGEMVERRAKPK